MNKAETVKLFGLISALYPRDKSFAAASPEMVTAWATMLQDKPFDAVCQAVYAHTSTNVFPPAVADIREECARIEHPEDQITAEEAWQYAIKAVRRYGYNRWDEARASMPENVAEYVREWYRDICMSESIEIVRGQFVKGWTRRQDRNHRQALMPPVLREIAVKAAPALMEGGKA